MKLPNPPETPFEKETEEYGYRTTFGQEEIVNKKTGQSNMSYYQPEPVVSPKNHDHTFKILDIGKREFECKCGWQVTANVTQIIENKKGMFLKLHQGKYPVLYL